MKHLSIISATIFVLFFSLSSFTVKTGAGPKKVEIRGVVQDSKMDKFIPGVSVSFDGRVVSKTDSMGAFSFYVDAKHVKDGSSVYVFFSKEGYKTVTQYIVPGYLGRVAIPEEDK